MCFKAVGQGMLMFTPDSEPRVDHRHNIAAATENELVHYFGHWTRECVMSYMCYRALRSDGLRGIKGDTQSKQGASISIILMARTFKF